MRRSQRTVKVRVTVCLEDKGCEREAAEAPWAVTKNRRRVENCADAGPVSLGVGVAGTLSSRPGFLQGISWSTTTDLGMSNPFEAGSEAGKQ